MSGINQFIGRNKREKKSALEELMPTTRNGLAAKSLYKSTYILAEHVMVVTALQYTETSATAALSGFIYPSTHNMVIFGGQQSTPILDVMIKAGRHPDNIGPASFQRLLYFT